MRAVFLPIVGLLLPGCVYAATATLAAEQTEIESPISITWRLIENQADNRYRAELAICNDSKEPLSRRWSLYFNSSSRLLPESVKTPIGLKHVNGDFYVLRPAEDCPPLDAGERRVIEYVGVPWAINVSDAPSGFYIVFTNEAGAERPPLPVPRQLAPFPPSRVVRRGAGDQLPIVTPASRFQENEPLHLLPADELPPVVPTPVHATALGGRVTIARTAAVACEPRLESEAQYLATCLRRSFDIDVKVVPELGNRPGVIQLRVGPLMVAGVTKQAGDEAYRLTARPDAGIEIVGTDPAGVFYGIQSLRALLPLEAYERRGRPIEIAAIQIEDAPRFGYRGLHLDVGRNFQTVDTVKKLLELMAFYKLNRFHWHLTDDEGWRIEIKALPELTSVGGRRGHSTSESEYLMPSLGSGPFPDPARSPGSGCYSQDELVDVLQYANERHITVIPELDFPGHARSAIKAMAARARHGSNDYLLTDPKDNSKYESVQMWRDNVVDVGMESTYRFFDLVVAELADVYRRAGVRLEYLHLGGDEVPAGAWESSPACQSIALKDSALARGQQLQLYFLRRSCELLAKRSITPACWEDCLLFVAASAADAKAPTVDNLPIRPTVYVWNNVWGWGREDAAYRLANAGYDVVLCNATHLYFDLACEKDPYEPGYYWAGFVDTRAPFEFNPFDVFQNARSNAMGQPLAPDQFAKRIRLSDDGRKHILGIQGQLWGENLRSAEQLEYMAFPRMIALAERAWAAEPAVATIDDSTVREKELARAWNQFANCLGQRELPRFDSLAGGVGYRLPPPGAVVRAGVLYANTAFPGLTIHYSINGSEPTSASPIYHGPVAVTQEVKLRTFDTRGRGSRTVAIPMLELD